MCAAANRKLKNGVTPLYDGFNRVFKTAGGMVPSPAVKSARRAEQKQSLQEEMRSTAGRRIKVWKLKAEAAEEGAVKTKVKEVLDQFGTSELAGICAAGWLLCLKKAMLLCVRAPTMRLEML